jgi:hypothetical protein
VAVIACSIRRRGAACDVLYWILPPHLAAPGRLAMASAVVRVLRQFESACFRVTYGAAE